LSATRWNEHELLRKLLLKILSGNKPLVFDNAGANTEAGST
jgi:hypothetical protein